MKPGTYPVLVARLGALRVVGLALVKLSSRRVTRWEPARHAGRRGDATYSVDTGTGGFADAEARDALVALVAEDEAVLDALVDASDDAKDPWVLHEVGEGHTIAIFNSGHGDGTYRSHWGLDAKGDPVCLVTDFEVFSIATAPSSARAAAAKKTTNAKKAKKATARTAESSRAGTARSSSLPRAYASDGERDAALRAFKVKHLKKPSFTSQKSVRAQVLLAYALVGGGRLDDAESIANTIVERVDLRRSGGVWDATWRALHLAAWLRERRGAEVSDLTPRIKDLAAACDRCTSKDSLRRFVEQEAPSSIEEAVDEKPNVARAGLFYTLGPLLKAVRGASGVSRAKADALLGRALAVLRSKLVDR